MRGVKEFVKICWKFNHSFIIMLGLVQVIEIVSALSVLILPRYILNSIFLANNISLAVIFILSLLSIMLIIGLCRNILSKQILISKMKTFKLFQEFLGKKMMAAPLEYIESENFLNIKSKAEQYLYGGGNGFAYILDVAFGLLGKMLTLIAYLAVIITLDFTVILVLIALLAINLLFNIKVQKKNNIINLEKSVKERRSSYYNNLFQDFNYGKEIKVNHISHWLLDKYSNQLSDMLVFYKQLANNNFLFGMVSTLLSVTQQGVSYGYVLINAIRGNITVGDFSMYLTAISSFASSIKEIVNDVVTLGRYTDYYKAYTEYISVENIYEERPSTTIHKPYVIEFKDVSFRYSNQQKDALQHISTRINDREKISIVGSNGAGKSTFIKLLLGIYKPICGCILINGVDIHSISYTDYIKLFATVFQDFKFFSLPLIDNLLFDNKKQISEEEVYRVLDDLGMIDKMNSLPKGLKTTIYRDFDKEGYTPSGGEAQKLAIARAVLKDAEIVVLDEPTASLDPKAEYDIYKRFNELAENKTSLFISHRLSSTKLSDKIIVFDDGKIVGQGTHEELMKSTPLYHDLYSMQSSYYK